MRIQFEIKESLINILDQLMHSDFWATEIKEDESGKKIIKIKDLAYNLEAVAEVMGNEIFIKTALSKYTYRIYEVKGECWCEYVGAYRGFLEQKLLPLKKSTFLPEYLPALVGTGLYQEDMVFWPSTHSVMANIVPNYINGIVYGCLVEAYCSEHNARMQAMQNATDSATDMLNELNITYNRVRQADITQELTEIIGGANAQKRK